jgi:hypothetical protein
MDFDENPHYIKHSRGMEINRKMAERQASYPPLLADSIYIIGNKTGKHTTIAVKKARDNLFLVHP